jgi:hypothetical protein
MDLPHNKSAFKSVTALFVETTTTTMNELLSREGVDRSWCVLLCCLSVTGQPV